MQVMPIAWKSYSLPPFKNVTVPVQNKHFGAPYLADLLEESEDWNAVLRAYYPGGQNYNNKNYERYANPVGKKLPITDGKWKINRPTLRLRVNSGNTVFP
jgi:hypothetical protein